jgi:hypothetical protein
MTAWRHNPGWFRIAEYSFQWKSGWHGSPRLVNSCPVTLLDGPGLVRSAESLVPITSR